MALPQVDTEHIHVAAEDSVTFANAHALSISDEVWKALGAPVQSGEDLQHSCISACCAMLAEPRS